MLKLITNMMHSYKFMIHSYKFKLNLFDTGLLDYYHKNAPIQLYNKKYALHQTS